ncbi:hypothetical protein Sste5344_002334 [Sporothrix stenoceras]
MPTVPEDVARICGIPEGHANDLTTALAIVYEVDDRVGAAVDTILQRLFYTVTSQALRAATMLPPAAMPTPATATNPPPTYASKAATQTTPLQQQINQRHGNTNPIPATATKPPPREEGAATFTLRRPRVASSHRSAPATSACAPTSSGAIGQTHRRACGSEEETPDHVLLSCTATPPRPPGWPQTQADLNRCLQAGKTARPLLRWLVQSDRLSGV